MRSDKQEGDMGVVKGVAAAALLLLSMSPAVGCDDFDDDKALTAAADAAKLAQAPIPQQAPGAEALAAPAPGQSAPAAVTAVEPTPAPTQTTENSAGSVRR
jgi:hypothetical protein